MTNKQEDEPQPNQESENISTVDEAVVVEKEGIGFVWLVPLIAILIGGWLAYEHFKESPIIITISFDNGEGIVAGKTEIRYQGIKAGVVRDLKLNQSLRGVTATVEMDRQAEKALTTDTQFWLVKPEISISGVSGLDTLVTGNYIALYPGDGEPQRHYTAINERPPIGDAEPGLHVMLYADDLGSISVGAPVNYKKIKVGTVQDYSLKPAADGVLIRLHIFPEYKHLLKQGTRFWNSGGIDVSGSLSSFNIRTDSLATIIAGGVSFFTPENVSDTPAKNGDQYFLYEHYDGANVGLLMQLRLTDAEGLVENQTKLHFKGYEIGTVREINYLRATGETLAILNVNPEFADVLVEGSQFWLVKPELSLSGISGLDTIVKGNHIEVAPGRGKPKFDFVGLNSAPQIGYDIPGLHLTITSRELPSVSRGTPILYRKVPVGEVLSYSFNSKANGIDIHAHIKPEFEHLVRENSRFWNASGISASGGLGGINVRVESLASVIKGGLAFYNPLGLKAKAAKDGTKFKLWGDYDEAHELGLNITLLFNHGDGLSEGTPLKYQGVKVGEVKSVKLNNSMQQVVAKAFLEQDAEDLAKEGTKFWLVSASLGLAKTANLETLVTGKYIEIKPGSGDRKTQFVALPKPPAVEVNKAGLNLVLTAPTRNSLKKGVNIYYRQVPVGEVKGYALADTADHVKIFVNIYDPFTALVRKNSKFWNSSGVSVDLGLFSATKIRTESLETILEGGISLATPDNHLMDVPAIEGEVFHLHSEKKTTWEAWSPTIHLNEQQ